jgi:GNAT superfamily N-acetyltransferase
LTICYKEILDKNTVLTLKISELSGRHTFFDVKAFLTEGVTLKDIKEIGKACISVDGKKCAKLLDIYVNKSYRHRGIGSKMLKLMVDYITDGTAKEVHGDITASEDLRKAIDFYTKNGFIIDEFVLSEGKHTVVNLALNKPKFGEFFNLYEVERITRGLFYKLC